jgi:hypothetical protein
MTYHVYSPALGYVQGMSDLLSPIYVVYDGDESASFWAFSGWMRIMVCATASAHNIRTTIQCRFLSGRQFLAGPEWNARETKHKQRFDRCYGSAAVSEAR